VGEAFGVAGSAVGIISAGIQTAQGILWYYGAWKDRDDDISNMCASLNNLAETLKALRETVKPPTLFSEIVKENVEKSINAFNGTLNRLKDELEKVKDTEPPKPGARSRIRRHVQRALYPFKEATLRKIQGVVSEARSSLTLALDVLKLFVYLGLIRICLQRQS
jgi:ankyrin repeat domain-containing protein 50